MPVNAKVARRVPAKPASPHPRRGVWTRRGSFVVLALSRRSGRKVLAGTGIFIRALASDFKAR
jgi:hypothetical protein